MSEIKRKTSISNLNIIKNMKISIHIGIIGPSKCGKSSLINVFISKTFKHNINEETILNIHKLILNINNKQVELLITEIQIDETKTNQKIAQEIIKSMDVIFLCHEMVENDLKFNEEYTRKLMSYINNITNNKNILIYIVGCKLDQKLNSISENKASIYIYDNIKNNYNLTQFGQRIKTFVDTNNIKNFYATSSLLNINITELFENAIGSMSFQIYKNLNSNFTLNYSKETQELVNNNLIFDEDNVNDYEINEDDFLERCHIF